MKINWRIFGGLAIAFFALEIFSFAATYNLPAFILLVIATAVLTAYRSEYGLLVLLSELFIGSMGHFFYLELQEARLPLRIGMFAALMSVFSIQFIWQIFKKRGQSVYWQSLSSFKGWRPYFLLAGVIFIAFLNAWWQGNNPGIIFSDLNGWLYLSIIIPVVAVYGQPAAGALERLKTIFLASVLWLSVKTLFILFIFAHDASVAPALYYWLRRILGGEVTVAVAGWPRVFIQGQVFVVIAYLLVFWLRPTLENLKGLFTKKQLPALLLASLLFSTVLISLSRSFWVGLASALFLSGAVLLWREKWKGFYLGVAWLAVSFVFSLTIIYGLMAIPYNRMPNANLGQSLIDRVTDGNEPAAASRWALLPVLWQEISDAPILGRGYGATVTYFSRDPRVLAINPSGEYTTYAFEWGYLDIWLKLGFIGLAAYLWLLASLIWSAAKKSSRSSDKLYLGLGVGLFFLAVTNFFTPYLNHPLGLGYLALSSCLIWANKVY